MKVVLIQPINSQLISRIPLGLLSIASYVAKHSNHDINIVDLATFCKTNDIKIDENIYRNCSDFILNNFPADVYGFSTLVTTEIPSIQISRRIKETRSTCKIFFGNQWASLNDIEAISEFWHIDAIVRGEGEVTTLELLNAWESDSELSNVEGITYRNQYKVYQNKNRMLLSNLDDIPSYDFNLLLPSYDHYSPSEYGGHYGLLEFGRGCPYACVFCSTTLFWNRRVRTFSIKRTVHDMKRLVEMGFDFIEFTYDNFGTNRQEIIDFCYCIIAERIQVNWSIRCRLDYLDEELVKCLKAANCTSVLVGVESGSMDILDKVGKKISYSVMLRSLKFLTDAGIRVDASFISGLPFELTRDSLKTIEMAALLRTFGKLAETEIHFVSPIPGTKFAYDAINNGTLQFADDPHISPDFSKYLTWQSIDNYNGNICENAVRFSSDQKLINKYPNLFAAYGYIENDNVKPIRFASITTYTNILLQFYPMTIYLLCSTTNIDIISSFEKYCREKGVENTKLISNTIETKNKIEVGYGEKTEELLKLFEGFLLMQQNNDNFFTQVFKYEKLLTELSVDFDFLDKNKGLRIDEKTIQSNNILTLKIRIATFTYDILSAKNDLQQSLIDDSYDVNWRNLNASETNYVFKCIEETKRYVSGIEILKISNNLKKLLETFDGTKTVNDVINLLYPDVAENVTKNIMKKTLSFLNLHKEYFIIV